MLAQTLVDPVADHALPQPQVADAPDAAARAPHPSWHALPWRWVSADWLNALSAEWVAALSLSALAQLSRLTCGGLSPDFVRALSPLQLAALFHVEALSPAAVAVLTPAQVSALPQVGRWIDADWINALDDAALAAMTPEQLGDLGVCTLAGLSPRVLRLMSAEQRSALSAPVMVEGAVGDGSQTRHPADAAVDLDPVVIDHGPMDPVAQLAAPRLTAEVAGALAMSQIPRLTDEAALIVPDTPTAPVASGVEIEPVTPVGAGAADLAEEDWLNAGLECLDGAMPVVDGLTPGTSLVVEAASVDPAEVPFVGPAAQAFPDQAAEQAFDQMAGALAPPSAGSPAGAADPSARARADALLAWEPVILDPRLRPRAPHAARAERTRAASGRPPGRLPVRSRSMAARWRALVSPARPGLRIARIGLAAGRRLDALIGGGAAWADPPLAPSCGDSLLAAGCRPGEDGLSSGRGQNMVRPGAAAPPLHGHAGRPPAGAGQPAVRPGGPPGQGGWGLMTRGLERAPPASLRAVEAADAGRKVCVQASRSTPGPVP